MRIRPAVFAVLLLTPLLVSAQEIESIAGVRLTFDRPGARSLAMGSASIAAKDATVASTNPAAIAGSPRTFSIETRKRTLEGRYIGDADLNTFGLESTTRGISSATATLPMMGATWSFFYDEPLDVQHSTASAFANPSTTAFFLCGGQLTVTPCNGPALATNLPVTYPIDASLRLRRYGAAAAWQSGPLAVGASVRRERLQQRAEFVDVPLFPTLYAGTADVIDDNDTTWSAGATWSFGSFARVGATYASGGSFAGQRTFPQPNGPLPSIEFRTPPTMGAGISIDALPNLTLAADAVRVNYSTMMHDKRALFPQASEIGYPDVTELHAGAEYRMGRLALRGGWWRDPAHSLQMLNGVEPAPPFSLIVGLVNESEDHLTAGIGFGTKNRFDASIDRGAHSTRVAMGVSTTF
jgi:hypothetical protein